MPRPRRAAATRAVAAMTVGTDKENSAPLKEKFSAEAPSVVSPRRLRRASYRSGKRGTRSLSLRRADFERIAAHHVATLRRSPLLRLSSAATELSTEESDPVDDVVLRPEYPQRILGEEVDDARVRAMMRAMLQKLRAVGNLSEAEEEAKRDEVDVRAEMENRASSEKNRSPEEGDDLHGLAQVLASDRFVSHDSSDVRLLAACALAELLRIFAPDPPISSRKLHEVCSLFIEQLAVMASPNDDMEAYRFSLLEQLATVKTFVIFCDEDEIVCDLFACCYAISRPHQPPRVRQYLADILASLLDEAEDYSYSVLDALVAPLVAALKYSSEAVALAEAVLRRSSNVLQVPLCSMLNASIRRMRSLDTASILDRPVAKRRTPVKGRRKQTSDNDVGELSTLHEYVSDILVSLNKITPDVLIYVIPSLEDRIRAADEGTRHSNVHLLGRLLTSRRDMTESYPSLFAEFLSRNRDVSPLIRGEVCLALPQLMQLHPKHREVLDQMLKDRALDREEPVRLLAVRAIGSAGGYASEELWKVLATRLRDRKPSIRHEALSQLSHAYSEQTKASFGGEVGSPDFQWNTTHSRRASSEDSEPATEWTQSDYAADMNTDRLSWLPDTLVQAHVALRAAGDNTTALEIENVIFERIAGVKSDANDMSDAVLHHFLTFLSALSDNGYAHVNLVARERYRTRELLTEIADNRLKSRRRPRSAVSGDKKNADENIFYTKASFTKGKQPREPNVDDEVRGHESLGIAEQLSGLLQRRTEDPEHTRRVCVSLATAIDLRIYEKIVRACDYETSAEERAACCRDGISRFGSKSPVGIFLRDILFPVCLPGVFSLAHFEDVCELAARISQSSDTIGNHNRVEGGMDVDARRSDQLRGILRYLETIGSHMPTLLCSNISGICSLATLPVVTSNSSRDVILVGTKLLSRMSTQPCMLADENELMDCLIERALVEKFDDLANGVLLSKWSARALIWLNAVTPTFHARFIVTVKAMAYRLDDFDGDVEKIIASVTSLSQVAKHCPRVFCDVGLAVFDFARVLLCGSLNQKVRKHADLVKLDTVLHAAQLAELTHRAVKLLVYALPLVDSADEEIFNVVTCLTAIITKSHGDIYGLQPELSSSSDYERGCLNDDDGSMQVLCSSSQMFAGHGILFLARHPALFRRMPPSAFHSALQLLQHILPASRASFATKIYTSVLRKRLPFRWVAGLALMANDTSRENTRHAKRMLTTLLRHRRNVFEKARVEGNPQSLQLLPEAVVPDLIWLLANLKSSEQDENAGFPHAEKSIELMLDRLLESNDFAGVLNEYIESLSIARDATEPEDQGTGPRTDKIHALGRIAGAILKKKQAGRKWNLSQHPGKTLLPKDLYVIINRDAETSGVMPPSLVEVAKMFDENKVRVSGKKQKAGNLVCLAKPSETLKPLPSIAETVAQSPESSNQVVQSIRGKVGIAEIERSRDTNSVARGTPSSSRRGKKRRSKEIGSANEEFSIKTPKITQAILSGRKPGNSGEEIEEGDSCAQRTRPRPHQMIRRGQSLREKTGKNLREVNSSAEGAPVIRRSARNQKL